MTLIEYLTDAKPKDRNTKVCLERNEIVVLETILVNSKHHYKISIPKLDTYLDLKLVLLCHESNRGVFTLEFTEDEGGFRYARTCFRLKAVLTGDIKD